MKKIVFSAAAVFLSCTAGFAQTDIDGRLSGLWAAIVVLIVMLLAVIGAIVYYYLTNNNQKIQNRKKGHDNRVILDNTIESIKSRLTDLEQRMDTIQNTQYSAKNENRQSTERQQPVREFRSPGQISQPPHTVQKLSSVRYPKAIIQNGFRDDLSDNQGDSYFKFSNIKGNNANFEYCGTDFEKAKANKDTLEIVCEISGTSVTAHDLVSETAGVVQFKDGKWEIIKKARIKFI